MKNMLFHHISSSCKNDIYQLLEIPTLKIHNRKDVEIEETSFCHLISIDIYVYKMLNTHILQYILFHHLWRSILEAKKKKSKIK